MTNVTAAIIQNDKKDYLLCRRGPGGSCAYLWEFPGGKQEKDETLEECLVRECREELSIQVIVGGMVYQQDYRYPEKEMHFSFFHTTILQGVPTPSVHVSIEWVPWNKLCDYPLCPVDSDMLRNCKEIRNPNP